jgi:hypothetical protein
MSVNAASVSIALSNTGMVANKSYNLLVIITQDVVGGRLVYWPSNIKWSQNTAPSLSTTANATDLVSLFTVNSGVNWYGALSGKGHL